MDDGLKAPAIVSSIRRGEGIICLVVAKETSSLCLLNSADVVDEARQNLPGAVKRMSMSVITTIRHKSSIPDFSWRLSIYQRIVACLSRPTRCVERRTRIIFTSIYGLMVLTLVALWPQVNVHELAAAPSHVASMARYQLGASHRERVGIYVCRAPGWPKSITSALASRLEAAGMKPVPLSIAELTNPAIINGRDLPALILVNPAMIPADAVAAVKSYARSPGLLVSLGAPAFTNMEFRLGSRWVTESQMLRRIKQIIHNHPLALPQHARLWMEASSSPTAPSKVVMLKTTSQLPPGEVYGYKFRFHLNGWCNFRSPAITVPAQNHYTVFWAKGGPHARQLNVECDERDGSRWIAVVKLHSHWTRYVLPEVAFHGWPDPPVDGRFFPGDHLHLPRATTISFGLANGFTTEKNGRYYTVDVAGVGTARLPSQDAQSFAAALASKFHGAPLIHMISPTYKLFPVTDMHTLAVNPRQAIAPLTALPTPASTMGLYPRAQSTGLDLHMATRYIPLLNCVGTKGRFVAIAAALELPSTAASKGQGATLSIPITDGAFFGSPSVQDWLTAVIKRVQQGLYLAEGGASRYATFANTPLKFGAVVMNKGLVPQTVQVVSTFTTAGGKIAYQHSFSGVVPSGTARAFTSHWTPAVPLHWERVYRVTTVLQQQTTGAAKIVDRLVGSLRVLCIQSRQHFVTSSKGLFYLRGKPWYVDGVNFWPESSMAQENGALYQHWSSRQSYDPQTVERNLRDVKAIGFNTISIPFDRGDNAWNVLDVLARARELGLHVNLSIAGIDQLGGEAGGPGKFNFKAVQNAISELHLASNATLFAYDIAWEPFWGRYNARRRLDAQWRMWIIRHYGSVKKAQAAWRFPVPRRRGQVTNPREAQILAGRNGKAAAMVLAYHHFLSALLVRTYGRAIRLIHQADPHHLVSFRMSMAGYPKEPPDDYYAFTALRHIVDIFEPEAYGHLMSQAPLRVRRAAFTIQYARAVNPALPVIYAEYGNSQWNNAQDSESASAAKRTANIYAGFYRTILAAGGNGAICWWFPGGYRCGERSDYGIINPDRSWRPVTYVIHHFAARMEASRPLPVPRVWIPIQLGDGQSEYSIYKSVKKKFWAAYQAGRLPGLKATWIHGVVAVSRHHFATGGTR